MPYKKKGNKAEMLTFINILNLNFHLFRNIFLKQKNTNKPEAVHPSEHGTVQRRSIYTRRVAAPNKGAYVTY